MTVTEGFMLSLHVQAKKIIQMENMKVANDLESLQNAYNKEESASIQ